MLYKNLPDEELRPVMCVRILFDIVAAVVFLLKGEGRNALAVWKAWQEYRRMRPEFVADRSENLKKTVSYIIHERTKNSILWQFYARGCKRFSQLSDFKHIKI